MQFFAVESCTWSRGLSMVRCVSLQIRNVLGLIMIDAFALFFRFVLYYNHHIFIRKTKSATTHKLSAIYDSYAITMRWHFPTHTHSSFVLCLKLGIFNVRFVWVKLYSVIELQLNLGFSRIQFISIEERKWCGQQN